MNEIGEIKAAIHRFRNDTTWLVKRKRWNKDLDLFRLKTYDPGQGYFSYTTNEPRNLAIRLISMLSSSPVLISTPDDAGLTDEELEKANNNERFIYGCLNLIDEAALGLPSMMPLKEQIAWYLVVRGGLVARPFVFKEEKGETNPDGKIWDIYSTAYGEGKKGLAWAAHTYKITRDQAKSIFGKTINKNDIDVIDFWDEENNGVIVDTEWAIELKPHGLDYCPVFVVETTSMPTVEHSSYTHTSALRGESCFAQNRDLYPVQSKTISDYLTMVRRGVKVPLGIWSVSGDTIDEDIWQTEKAATVYFNPDTIVKPLLEPAMPKDAAVVVNIVSSEVQRGGLSHVSEGQLGTRLSGFAINQLRSDITVIIAPFAEAMARTYKVLSMELLKQFGAGGFKPIEARGRTSRNVPFGLPKAIKIRPSMIEPTWFPEVTVEPVLPTDDAQRWQLARMAKEMGMMSDKSIRTDMLGIKDNMLEEDRIAREFGLGLPLVRLFDAYMAAWAAGDLMRAANIRTEAERLLGAGAMGGGQGQARQPTGLEQASMGMPGAGVPPAGMGVPSSTMPSEMMGGLPGGAMNAKIPAVGEEV